MNAGRELDALVAEKPYKCRRCKGSNVLRYRDGRRGCNDCAKTQRRRWYEANKAKVSEQRKAKGTSSSPEFKAYRRKWALATRYGITPERYEQMLKEQEGKCAICGRAHSQSRPLHVDHCHATGAVRGLLCFKCNPGLANFMDSPEFLTNAAKYVRLAALKAVGVTA